MEKCANPNCREMAAHSYGTGEAHAFAADQLVERAAEERARNHPDAWRALMQAADYLRDRAERYLESDSCMCPGYIGHPMAEQAVTR